MPVVPFTNAPRTAPLRKLPADAEPFAMMAAAQMDAEGRLVHPNIEDRRDQKPEDIGPIVQFPGEQLPMHAIDKLGADAGADILDKQLVDDWLKRNGK